MGNAFQIANFPSDSFGKKKKFEKFVFIPN